MSYCQKFHLSSVWGPKTMQTALKSKQNYVRFPLSLLQNAIFSKKKTAIGNRVHTWVLSCFAPAKQAVPCYIFEAKGPQIKRYAFQERLDLIKS